MTEEIELTIKVEALLKDELADAPGSPGITRRLAFQGDDFKVLRSVVEPATRSGWHHHGAYHVYGYMVSGTARFDWGPGGTESTTVRPGDFFHVAPGAIHRDVNPSDTDPQEVLLFLRGSGLMVVNVDGPEAPA
ncbi:MAG: cupin domain-containing protein [Gemmatimonadetes bacterium]|nr:cupin domain-containing protein [Gemmatimonadota bacterium]